MIASVLIALAAAAPALSGSYDCVVDRQTVINEDGVQPQAVVEFEDLHAWNFSVRLREQRNAATEIVLTWPSNPFQLAGTHAALAVGPGHLAFVALSRPPCMLTESNCMALVQLSARGNDGAFFTIMPTGLAGNDQTGRTQLHVIFTGTCRRQNGS